MAPTPDTGLERFIAAQAPVYDTVCAELAAGAKRTHWMWFIFPQLRGLGRSVTDDDRALIDQLAAESHAGASTRDVLRALLTSDAIRYRLAAAEGQ